jgi:hypothetical protein
MGGGKGLWRVRKREWEVGRVGLVVVLPWAWERRKREGRERVMMRRKGGLRWGVGLSNASRGRRGKKL